MSTQSVCNICGANYIYRNGKWICPACGAFKAEELSNEEVTLLYNAAQKLRLSNFSEAEEEYSDIIEKFPQNANAYWGRLLAKYGIKYEEDFDGRKIPTCYAASIESVITDKDYLRAIELAEPDTRAYFTQQAEYIERVRQEWINKAQKEKPYDVFICYKDSDLEKGIERTEDSIIAQEIYIHLIEQGYRVFFSREGLRDKVGEKYEPYIFNALSTAKVMLVYGSSAEYIKSTWLKNEWHRYYKKVSSGEKHQESLIVACDGFSPSELPTILSSRQCLDAKRKSFFSDLDRCIRRIVQESKEYAPSAPKKDSTIFSGLHEHTYRTKVVKPTCIAKGYTIHRCDCGYEYKDTYTDLVDHKFKVVERVDPTCTTSGYEKKTCEICGESITVTLPALEHQFTRWIESKHPTCTEDGESQRQCTRCGYTETKTIAKTGHQYGGWSGFPDGTQTCYCVNCGHTRTRERATSTYQSQNNSYYTPTNEKTKSGISPWASFFLCLFLGMLGVHKFVEKKVGHGFLYMFTAGLFYFGWISDCVKYFKYAKNGVSPITVEQQTFVDEPFRFSDIFGNWGRYCKSLFTSETTKAQKMRRILGLLLWLAFALIVIPSGSAGAEGNTVSDTFMTIGGFVILFAIPFGIATGVVSSKENRNNKRLGITPTNNDCCRAVFKHVSYFFLLLAISWFSLSFTDVSGTDTPLFTLSFVVLLWAFICSLYAHFPARFKWIRFTDNSKPVKRSNIAKMGAIISVVVVIVGVVVDSIGA